MGQSTRLYTKITFFDKCYNTKSEVERDLENAYGRLEKLKKELIILVMMTEPNKFAPKNQSPSEYLNSNAQVLIDEIGDLNIEIWKLEILLDRWEECHTKDGLGKYPPEGEQHTYIDGTFVFTDKYPTKEALLA